MRPLILKSIKRTFQCLCQIEPTKSLFYLKLQEKFMNHRKKWHITISDFRKQTSLLPRGINPQWKNLETSACTHFETPLKRFKTKTKLLNYNSLQQQKMAIIIFTSQIYCSICYSMTTGAVYHDNKMALHGGFKPQRIGM